MTDLAAWYQKKICTYDRQEWDSNVERHAPFKPTKLRDKLIDVDLIRGSSFPKAKSVQSFTTIVRLALIRTILFPLWTKWWADHTSPMTTKLFCVLWILQATNFFLYFSVQPSSNLDSSCILVPLFLMGGLGIVHAFIVSTTHPHHSLRSSSISAGDMVNSSSDMSHASSCLLKGVNKSTQTIFQTKSSEDMKKWIDLKVPEVCLTPPPIHTVKFDLGTPKPKSDEDESPVLRMKLPNKYDEKFERLNGNISNCSENSDDINYNKLPSTKITDKTVDDEFKPEKLYADSDKVLFDSKVTHRVKPTRKYWENDRKDYFNMADNNINILKYKTRPPRKQGGHVVSSSDEECDSASASLGVPSHHTDFAQATNSEDCSYCSESNDSESDGLDDASWEPFAILNPGSDRISCTIWQNGRLIKMSVNNISQTIIKRAEEILDRDTGGLRSGIFFASLLAAIPSITKLLQILVEIGNDQINMWELPMIFLTNSPVRLLFQTFGATFWERVINIFSTILRLSLGALVFFLLAVAQRAFHQRFLYAKLFSHLTSSRRARQSTLPHFRLNSVRNIKTWLSVRSFLMRRGSQRSVDVIVSAAFILLVLLISFLVIDLLQDQNQGDPSHTAETLGWVVAIGAVLLRLVALGTRASRKHRCLPVLLTEQINLHLAMERRPASKDRFVVANNVLKLAADLLKELESPFKISGLSTNPYLYTITKVVVLSALSGVLSDLLGFKLKLHKIKIK